jgi:hypothetical protein
MKRTALTEIALAGLLASRLFRSGPRRVGSCRAGICDGAERCGADPHGRGPPSSTVYQAREGRYLHAVGPHAVVTDLLPGTAPAGLWSGLSRGALVGLGPAVAGTAGREQTLSRSRASAGF